MKSPVGNAKECADVFLFLFFSESHLRYHYLKVKGIRALLVAGGEGLKELGT